jgi:hypothetical protein
MSLINSFAKDADVETDRLVAEFKARGGMVTKCVTSARTEDINYTNGFGRRKKQVPGTVDEA